MSFATADNGWVNTAESHHPDLLAQAQHILQTTRYCSLSTCSPAGIPWVSPVFFCYQGWTLYWSSAIAAQHSQNLYQNQGKGAIALYNSTADHGTGIGLYLAGTVREAEPEQVPSILSRLFARAGDPPPDRTATDYLGESPRRVYQFQPHTVWITGDRVVIGKQLVDTKIQLDLAALVAAVM